MLDDQRYYKEQNGSVENLKLKIFNDRVAKYYFFKVIFLGNITLFSIIKQYRKNL